ncbi:glutathione transferase [Ranunculus cassubicifolius]
MEKMNEVKLYGMWSGSPTKRVELALKLKGIPYEYVEEDLSNKSTSLLRHNPVHKKVPVLVHNNKSISESLVILEYIEETWNKYLPKLLPDDPYERAKVRFWANFYDQNFRSRKLLLSEEGEEKEKATEESNENACILEEGIKRDFIGKSPFFHGENLGYLDIVVGASSCSYMAMEEVVGVKLIDPDKFPLYFTWVTAMKSHPVVKETLPPHEKLVQRMINYREMAFKLPNKYDY